MLTIDRTLFDENAIMLFHNDPHQWLQSYFKDQAQKLQMERGGHSLPGWAR